VPLYLTEANIAKLLTPADAVEAVEGSFRRLAAGEVENRPRERTRLEDGALAVMWAVDRELGLAGLKTYVALPGGAPFVVVLFDTRKAELAAVIEADRLGQLRTGAASGVAAKYLARESASTLGVIGSGWQARSQVACIREALPGIERVLAWSPTRENLERFAAETGAEAADSARDCAGCDVVVTITSSRDPVLRGEWLREGALVCAAGANRPRSRELDNVVLERAAFVCCDSREQARVESGDLIEPAEAGVLDWLEVHELQDVVAGELEGRQADSDIVVFKSNGLAAWDVALGAVALAKAKKQKLGKRV
jgi:ornithine cyclodeaminase/alanine dehydrogenase